jgi:hypothetical protein
MNVRHGDYLKFQIKDVDTWGGGHVRIVGGMRSACFWSKNVKVKEHYEDLGLLLDGRTLNQVEWESMDRVVGQW